MYLQKDDPPKTDLKVRPGKKEWCTMGFIKTENRKDDMNQNIKVETNGEPKKGLCPAKGSGQMDRFH